MSDSYVPKDAMQPSELSDEQIEAVIAGAPDADTPPELVAFVDDLRSHFRSASVAGSVVPPEGAKIGRAHV